eukprot:NODE_128_length_17019_cov_0.764480.p15 type:complete len:111 gc:universal NODE_128_length_17019_cov_0.764480:12146-12478(+)
MKFHLLKKKFWFLNGAGSLLKVFLQILKIYINHLQRHLKMFRTSKRLSIIGISCLFRLSEILDQELFEDLLMDFPKLKDILILIVKYFGGNEFITKDKESKFLNSNVLKK